MKKIFFILTVLCCCFSVNAQNVGDVFTNSIGQYRITSINPNTVTLVKAQTRSKDNPRYGFDYSTVEYNGTTYDISSVQQDAFRHFHDVNARLYFNKLSNISTAAFYNIECVEVNLSGSQLTVISNKAFDDAKCTEISLPGSVTRISTNAFAGSTVGTFSAANLTYIDDAAFHWCRNLTSIDLSKVTYIGGGAFYECLALSPIDLSNVTYIGGNAFEECNNLKNITLPQCLKTVKQNAFRKCYLTSLTMYNTTETFESNSDIMANNGTVTMNIVDWGNKNVLSGNTGISQAITYKYNNETITGECTIPDDATILGEGALYHCIDLTIINMPAGLMQIGAKALAKCSNLCAIHCDATTAPAVANANAFSEVDKSINVIIPDNAESYYSYIHATGWKEFSNYLVSLQTVKGAAIIELNHTAGYNPSQAVLDIVADYSAQINAAADKAEVEAITQAGVEAIIAQIIIDRGLVKIGNLYYTLDSEHHTATVTYGGLEADGYATEEYTGSISIPESVTYDDATYSVTSIGGHAFQNCVGLTAITMPITVTKIDDNAFYSCKGLKTVLLPSLLSSIGDMSFFDCSAITSINCLAATPCVLGTDAFHGVNESIPVTVPEGSLEAYQQGPWGGFTNFVFNQSLDAAKTAAKNAITAALGSYYSVSYIGNLALNFCLRIDAATTIEQVEALGTEGLYAVTYAVSTYQEILGEMGDECTDCPTVEVTKGAKKVTLYNPEKVEFKKE